MGLCWRMLYGTLYGSLCQHQILPAIAEWCGRKWSTSMAWAFHTQTYGPDQMSQNENHMPLLCWPVCPRGPGDQFSSIYGHNVLPTPTAIDRHDSQIKPKKERPQLLTGDCKKKKRPSVNYKVSNSFFLFASLSVRGRTLYIVLFH